MTIFIDFINNTCFILSPKCGTQTVSKYLRLPINISYNRNEIIKVLKDPEFKKIIVVRDIIDRFFSGFYEDLKNNNCYLDLDISFYDYIKFLYFCNDNKIKNVNNLKIYYADKNKLIEWGGCSGRRLPITDSSGCLSGHIIHQKIHIQPYISLLESTDNVEIIDIKELNEITNIHENSKSYTDSNDDAYNYNSLLSDLKKNKIFPKKEKMLNSKIKNIINHIYFCDNEYIESIKLKFPKKNSIKTDTIN